MRSPRLRAGPGRPCRRVRGSRRASPGAAAGLLVSARAGAPSGQDGASTAWPYTGARSRAPPPARSAPGLGSPPAGRAAPHGGCATSASACGPREGRAGQWAPRVPAKPSARDSSGGGALPSCPVPARGRLTAGLALAPGECGVLLPPRCPSLRVDAARSADRGASLPAPSPRGRGAAGLAVAAPGPWQRRAGRARPGAVRTPRRGRRVRLLNAPETEGLSVLFLLKSVSRPHWV